MECEVGFFFNDTATTEIYTSLSSAASDVYKKQLHQFVLVVAKQDDSNSNATKYAEIMNHAQTTASRAAVDADEALRYAREAMAKKGSVDAGLASRIVNSRQKSARRALDIENELEKLIRRVDVLSSELATNIMR